MLKLEVARIANSPSPNSNIAARGSIGSTAATKFALNAFNATIARLQSQVTGVKFTSTDIISMLQLCSYETVALGYSAFCDLFSQQDFENCKRRLQPQKAFTWKQD